MDIKSVTPKPAEVVLVDAENMPALVDWLNDNSTVGKAIHQGERLYVPTLSGMKIAGPGDYVVRDAVGEFQSFTPEEFAARFQA